MDKFHRKCTNMHRQTQLNTHILSMKDSKEDVKCNSKEQIASKGFLEDELRK